MTTIWGPKMIRMYTFTFPMIVDMGEIISCMTLIHTDYDEPGDYILNYRCTWCKVVTLLAFWLDHISPAYAC